MMRAGWLALCCLGLVAHAEEQPGPPITMAVIGDRVCNPDQTQGDTWDTAWLADGRLLTQYNDGNGFSEPHQNVHHDGVCEIHGTPEDIAHLTGTDLNPGKLGSFLGQTYSTGLYEIDGALYHFICRSIQIPGKWAFYDTCLYKSVDGGANWINQRGEKNTYMPEKLETSTFPDKRWGEVDFIKYGQGGVAPDIDRARDFAYLASGPYLGRVRRADLRAWSTTFDPGKIEYYCGSNHADGEKDANWTHEIAHATSVTEAFAIASNIVWNPGLRRYLRTGGYGDSWQNPPIESTFFLDEAPHPWGPWKEIDADYIAPRAGDNLAWFYLMQPFMSADGTHMWATVSGRKPYGLQFLPIDLTTAPVQTKKASDAQLTGTKLVQAPKDSSVRSYIEGFTSVGTGCQFDLKIKTPGLYALRYQYQCDQPAQTLGLGINGAPNQSLPLGNTQASTIPWNEGTARVHLDAGVAHLSFSIVEATRDNPHLRLSRIQLGLLKADR